MREEKEVKGKTDERKDQGAGTKVIKATECKREINGTRKRKKGEMIGVQEARKEGREGERKRHREKRED